jgi:uncharacterized membrane protein (DUF106 family)
MATRDFRPLLLTWVVTLTVLAVWWWAVHHMTIWAELMKPLLPLILIPALWRTWHWLHARRRGDRRDHERRLESRREEP